MIKIRLGWSTLIVIFMLLLVACGSEETNSNNINNDEKFLSVGTGGTGGAWYGIWAAGSTLVTSESDNIHLDVQATGGSLENVRLLNGNSIEVANTTPDIAYFSYEGEREFDSSNENLRAIMSGNDMPLYIIVREDSDIHSLSDVTGKIISTGSPGSGTNVLGVATLDALGITEYQEHNLAHSEASDALIEGTIDVFLAMSGTPFPAATELTTRDNVRFIPLTEEEQEKVISENPYWAARDLPAGTYSDQDDDIPGIHATTVTLVNEDMNEQVVYDTLKILLDEHHESWIAGHNGAKDFSIEQMERSLDIILVPIHPGAKRFYEEHGLDVPQFKKRSN